MTAPSQALRRHAKILTLVGSGHAVSHFYMLALPPLFPLLRADLDASYAALGLLVTLLNVATGAAQIPAGFLVDRFGARRLLILGLALMGAAMTGLGLAGSYWPMLVLVMVVGIGNSVLHPADYAALSASVDRSWLGRAFSIHTFAGNVGFALAPGSMIALTALLGWRGALIAAGAPAFVVLGGLLVGRGAFSDEAGHAERQSGSGASAAGVPLLLSAPILLLFLFYVTVAMVISGVQTFSVTALHGHHGIDLAAASIVLSAFLVTSAVGVLLGGVIADRTDRHALITVIAFASAAMLMLAVGLMPLPALAIAVLFALVGLLQGSVRTSRDMMVRRVTPPGATGRVFAFVMTGLNVGAAITPVLSGLLLDLGAPQLVFLLLAGFLVAGVGVVLAVQAAIAARAAHSRGQEEVAAE